MDDHNGFKEEYREWVKSTARDAAYVLKSLSYGELDRVKNLYRKFSKDTALIFSKIQDKDRISDLSGDRLKGILLLETEAIVFSSSIFMEEPGIMDYALAMNRRFFIKGKWFDMIIINSSFIRQANDIVLTYTLEHELLQMELYKERLHQGSGRFSPEQKRHINIEAMRRASDTTGISEQDLLLEKELMLRLSTSCPLIPKLLAEIALFVYIEKNWGQVKHLGADSSQEWEKQLGEQLSRDFAEGLEFMDEIFWVFYSVLESETMRL